MGDVTMREAHPCLTTTNMMASMFVWARLQGAFGGALYFCGSSVTPGNGHDLSLLSGFCGCASSWCGLPLRQKRCSARRFPCPSEHDGPGRMISGCAWRWKIRELPTRERQSELVGQGMEIEI